MSGAPGVTLLTLAAAQAALGVRVLNRLRRAAGGERIERVPAGGDLDRDGGAGSAAPCRVSVVLPVLDEAQRLAPCLDGLLRQGPEVVEVLVVDGGSVDGTADLVTRRLATDGRLRLIDATPIPRDWNGKAWGLQVGLEHSAGSSDWVLTVDADVRPAPGLVTALLAHARRTGVDALSVATAQVLSGPGEALLHPALLTSLVYRLGPPGRATRRPAEVQANGQCFLVRRGVLLDSGGFHATRASLCEDVTLARHLARAGHAVGFYESDTLVAVQMYRSAREAWRNWPRSLTLRDQYSGAAAPAAGLLEVSLVQALPLPLLVGLSATLLGALPGGARGDRPALWGALAVNALLGALRVGTLAGMARAYRPRPWTYWLSPLCDIPVALALWRSLLRRDHRWRGRRMVTRWEGRAAECGGEL